MGQHDQHESQVASDRMDDQIRALVRAHGGDYSNHVVGHFELVAELHDPEYPNGSPVRVRWSPPGSSPHLSLGLLRAAATKLERKLSN